MVPATSHSFKTIFAVPMTCESCIEAVSDSLFALGTVTSVDASLADQLVTVEGTAAPSSLVGAIQSTGRDAILRGSGDPNSAAVSILESYAHLSPDDSTPAPAASADPNARQVRGLARMVQVAPTTTLVDLTVRGVSPGTYRASVRSSGNLQRGALSTGAVWGGDGGNGAHPEGSKETERGLVGTLEVDADGRGALFAALPFQVREVIGRGMVLTRVGKGEGEEMLRNDADTLAGVVARSAGVWDNDKLVCSCTGKTLWDERRDEVSKGTM